jgi:cytochrome b subunit of formate dehydrogenase
MSQGQKASQAQVRTERTFRRFTVGQRWEHAVLMLSSSALLLTGLPQKYRGTAWSQQILAVPEQVDLLRDIHHIAAVVLILQVLYHLGHNLILLTRRKLPGDLFPSGQDLLDAAGMFRHLLFLTEDKPRFGKYRFEQKFTYWFLFFAIAIMLVSGLILWFPIFFTRFLPGGIIPAARLAHSTEAVAAAVFVLLWHFFHVHLERLNLSIFTGRLSEEQMREYHQLELERLTDAPEASAEEGE